MKKRGWYLVGKKKVYELMKEMGIVKDNIEG